MKPRQTEHKDVDWIYLTRDTAQSMVQICVPCKGGNFLTTE